MTESVDRRAIFPPRRSDLQGFRRQAPARDRAPGAGPAVGHIEVAERHGIWTVTEEGAFVGDYRDRDMALAAAAFLRGSVQGSGSQRPDPWQPFRGGEGG